VEKAAPHIGDVTFIYRFDSGLNGHQTIATKVANF
jgi:hypothetical protein